MAAGHGRRLERVGDILRERVGALGWEQRFREEAALIDWAATVGPQIAAHARPSHIMNRRLTVVTESPVWTQQLSLLRTDLLRRLAERCGPGIVTELYFVTGAIEPPAPVVAPPRPPPAPAVPATMPASLAGEVAAIGDEGVREAVRRLILAALADGRAGS